MIMADKKTKDLEDAQENAENQILAADDGTPITPESIPAIADEQHVPIADGQIPVDSVGISDGQFNAISPTGEVNIQFQQGNYQQIASIPKIVGDKVQTVTNTLIPLSEVALIELLGSTSMYRRDTGQCDTVLENNQAFIDFLFKYTVDAWISQEVDQEAIAADANYILNKIKIIPGIQISVCQIDVTDGSLQIQGRI